MQKASGVAAYKPRSLALYWNNLTNTATKYKPFYFMDITKKEKNSKQKKMKHQTTKNKHSEFMLKASSVGRL